MKNKVLIVISDYYEEIGKNLLKGALTELELTDTTIVSKLPMCEMSQVLTWISDVYNAVQFPELSNLVKVCNLELFVDAE